MAKVLKTREKVLPGLQVTKISLPQFKKKKSNKKEIERLVTHSKSFCYQHSRCCYVVVHDASVLQALYGIDQIHGHNEKSVQVENDLFVFQIFVQWRALREFVTK